MGDGREEVLSCVDVCDCDMVNGLDENGCVQWLPG